ncbi:hypothetical protein [Kordia sp.]
MKKQKLKKLTLKKVCISKLKIKGGLKPFRGESDFNSVCPMCTQN